MQVRDLRLPNGKVMLWRTGEVVDRPPNPLGLEVQWDGPDSLAGEGITPPGHHTAQPYSGCKTGGNIVMDRLLNYLAEESERIHRARDLHD